LAVIEAWSGKMMRTRTALAGLVLAILTLATAAHAAPVWTVPGWYQTADTIVGPFVWKGPFADEASCRAELPANDEEAEFTCEYLAERPSWDT
jgi:hypothetical protein